MKYQAIILFGPLGAGKGTQAKRLSQEGNYFHFSSGEMFRNLNAGTELGAKVKALIDRGNFIDDQTTIALTKETLERAVLEGKYFPKKHYLLLDGVPRTTGQVPLLEEFVRVDQVIYLNVLEQAVLVDRLQKRALLENRKDDAQIETIQKRMYIYEKTTLPVLQWYNPAIIRAIDGSKTIDEVYQRINTVIKKK